MCYFLNGKNVLYILKLAGLLYKLFKSHSLIIKVFKTFKEFVQTHFCEVLHQHLFMGCGGGGITTLMSENEKYPGCEVDKRSALPHYSPHVRRGDAANQECGSDLTSNTRPLHLI